MNWLRLGGAHFSKVANLNYGKLQQESETAGTVDEFIEGARRAATLLRRASDEQRRAVLLRTAALVEQSRTRVLEANRRDSERATLAGSKADSPSKTARLLLSSDRLAHCADSLRTVAALVDPLTSTVASRQLDEDLHLFQVREPLGVVACVLEARPDALIQIAGLLIRSGNAGVIKGGSEAQETNNELIELFHRALLENDLPARCLTLLKDRDQLRAALQRPNVVQIVIARGSSELISELRKTTQVPILGHGAGVCHTYVDASADMTKAVAVCLDAKTDYPAACNATECVLVHESIASKFIPLLTKAFEAAGVTVWGDSPTQTLGSSVRRATSDHWGREFGSLECAVRVVASLDEAISFINEHSSGHTEAILTNDEAAARRFAQEVDSSSTFINASTRFADGYRYGLGAEVGISTTKLHARGPVGLDGLTTTKWILKGNGHVAHDYQGPGRRQFLHATTSETWKRE